MSEQEIITICEECDKKVFEEEKSFCKHCKKVLCENCYSKHLYIECIDDLIETCKIFLKKNAKNK